MMTILYILGAIYFIVGTYTYINLHIQDHKHRKKLKQNNIHLDRATEYFDAYLETGDEMYLKYQSDELKKVKP